MADEEKKAPEGAAAETFQFQAETKQLLDLMIHSIYTNHEIFLRELISNASDAIDKLRFASLTQADLLEGDKDFVIRLTPDAKAHTLTIADNGIGMSREELVKNIGTIAQSGTKEFLGKMQEAHKIAQEAAKDGKEGAADTTDKDLIGQFGVGFYSAFMVADKVTIVTRKAGETQGWKWESAADGTYTIAKADVPHHGTAITLHLGESYAGEGAEQDMTSYWTLEGLVKKYSDFIRYPIKMEETLEEPGKNEKGEIDEKAPTVTHVEDRTLNSMTPLWKRNKNDIKPEEYTEFYKHQFHAWDEPLCHYHTHAEGTIEYTALLYIPSKAPANLYYQEYEPGLQLYSRSVFIMDKCKDLLPDYLRFVKGLVDSPDLSLNISRELLQQNRTIRVIGKNLEKNILKLLKDMLETDRPKYEKFWNEYGRSMKAGVYNSIYDPESKKDQLADLLLFMTSKEGKLCTLKEYTDRMPADQKAIYFATGRDKDAIEHLPQMETVKDRGFEVLFLLDPVDEFCLEALQEYAGKKFQSLSRGDLDFGDAESDTVKKETETLTKDNDAMLKDVQAALNGKVNEVKLSTRLKDSPVCLVAGEAGPSFAMEQAFAAANAPMFKAQRILELNPKHVLFEKLKKAYSAGKDSQEFKDYCALLFDQALLLDGMIPDDPAALAQQIARMMAR